VPLVSARGAPITRYQGNEPASIEAELRWQFWRRSSARKYGIHMGLDLAFGPDNTAVYVQVGRAWARP
jgi:hypothetical protein